MKVLLYSGIWRRMAGYVIAVDVVRICSVSTDPIEEPALRLVVAFGIATQMTDINSIMPR